MLRVASLAGFLLIFWLALSGHYTPWLIGFGVICAVFVALLAHRMGLTDTEGHPTQLMLSAPFYWTWLAKEIALSAWAVAKTILTPGLPISPTMTVVKASQRTPAGVATYANSITLTPGTITVGASENELTIHALARDGALDVESGRMDKRVSAFEGSS